MSAPKKDGLKPLKDRTIKALAADAAGHGMRLQIGAEPIGVNCVGPVPHRDDCSPTRGVGAEPINGYAMTPANPNAAEIREVIAHLKTLADTFPGIIHAANGSGLSGSPMNTMNALDRACEMLRRHSIDVAEKEEKFGIARERELIQLMYDNGVKTGIEQEQARVKEARKGRRGAKKS